MTIATEFQRELNSLGAGGTATIAVADVRRKLTCELIERDSLAVRLGVLRLTTTELAHATKADLERVSAALAGRLTYLMEPIRPIELDADACLVQLRSSPPQRDDDGRNYFELIVRRGGELSLARYRKEPGQARAQVAASVTHEVLARLVSDFCAVLD